MEMDVFPSECLPPQLPGPCLCPLIRPHGRSEEAVIAVEEVPMAMWSQRAINMSAAACCHRAGEGRV